MSYFLSLQQVKRDHACHLMNKCYNIAEYYAQESTTCRYNNEFAKAKKYNNRAKHNLIRAYKIAIAYRISFQKISVALTDMNVNIQNL